MKFLDLYQATFKELLREEELSSAKLTPLDNNEDQSEENILNTLQSDESSELKKAQDSAQNVIWIEKIISLLTLLNKNDENVKNLIEKLAEGQVNVETVSQKENIIQNLLDTVLPPKKD